jgi:hypothetical protein
VEEENVDAAALYRTLYFEKWNANVHLLNVGNNTI